jgi:molybdenum cofactor synthesis domain-containing protein
VLAQRIDADAAYPVSPRSAMDGFAVLASETPGRLRIAGEIRMGHAFEGALPERSAVRIPTGGVLPAGANAVVPIEDVRVDGGFIEIAGRITADDCVNPPGSDMVPGEELLEPGRRIGGAELGLLATLGIVAVQVFRRPVIGVLPSGDELVDAATQPTAAQVRDSNRWAVGGALQALGAVVRHLPTAPDDAARLEALLKEAVATCDGVALTGGSSVGERDLTPQIVDRLGKPGVLVHGLKVKPGKPTVLASVDGKPVIGLPGNPASALMIMEAVAAPIVAALAGAALRSDAVPARLAAPLSKRPGWTWYVPMRLEGTVAHPLQIRSGSASLLARASGFAALDESIESLPAGAPVQVTRFRIGGFA